MSYVTYPNNPFPPSSESSGGGGEQYVLPIASDETLGGVKVGSNLTIDESGTLSAPTPYSLPVASDETLGGVKVGDNLTIGEDGTLSALTPYTPPAYSTSEFDTGKKWIDGNNVYGKVIKFESAITINSNAWSAEIDFVANKIISVSVLDSIDNNVFASGGNIFNNKLSILNQRASAITLDTIIIEYTKVEVEE